MEEDEIQPGPGGLSRRSALKRIGVGAAVVWSAPALLSTGNAFGAPTSDNPLCSPGNCTDYTCGGYTQCGTEGLFGICVCDITVEGNCFCWANFYCSTVSACNGTADCPAGYACVTTCCGQTCAPPCGVILSSEVGGATAAS